MLIYPDRFLPALLSAKFRTISCVQLFYFYRIRSMRNIVQKLLQRHIACGYIQACENAVIAGNHLTKDSRSDPLYAGAGTIAITAAARSVLLVAENPLVPRQLLLVSAKNNVAKDVPTLAYMVDGSLKGTKIQWLGPVPLTAKQITLAAGLKEGTELHRAVEFLREFLAAGPRPVADVMQAGKNTHKLSERTLDRAKSFLTITSTHEGGGQGSNWVWTLPPQTMWNDAKHAQDQLELIQELTKRDRKRRRLEYLDGPPPEAG